MWRVPAAISASVVAVTLLYSTSTGDHTEPEQSDRPLTREDGSSTDSFDQFDDDDTADDDERGASSASTRRGHDSPLDITPGWGFYADITPEVPMYARAKQQQQQDKDHRQQPDIKPSHILVAPSGQQQTSPGLKK